LITTPEALAEALDPIRRSDRVALDTEADSLHCYFEKLCLIQISVPGHDFLIDPLADLPLAPLFDELAGHQLIIQGLDYDLRLLRRAGMTETSPVFDTMIAARLIGLMEFSLSALLKRFFGIELAKGSQKANWARRPLSPKMIDYASNDTRYLLPLAEKLEAELHRLGRWEWFFQSCEKARIATQTSRERDLDSLWRITGSGELRDQAAALLRALWHWRDQEARTVDRPSFHIARNDLLIEAARTWTTGQRFEIPHLHGSRRKRYLATVDEALALSSSEWPKLVRGSRQRVTPEQERRFAELKKIRDHAAARHAIEPSLIAPKVTLESLANDPEDAVPRLLPWQRELLGLD